MVRKKSGRGRGIAPDLDAIFNDVAEKLREEEIKYRNWENDRDKLTCTWHEWDAEGCRLHEAADAVGRKAFSANDAQRYTNRTQAFARDFVPIAVSSARKIAQALKLSGYAQAVDSLAGDSPAEKVAIAILQSAIAGDDESVRVFWSKAFQASLDLGIAVLNWLADGLRFKVLNVSPTDPRNTDFSADHLNAIVEDQLMAMGMVTIRQIGKQQAESSEGSQSPRSQSTGDNRLIESQPTKRKQGGRPQKYDLKRDEQLFDAWKTGQHPSVERLANTFGISTKDAKLAIDRERKRRNNSH